LGMTALARSGIQFTEAQKEMVKGMVEANDTIGAQTIILAELERQFGGSAEAARNTLGGALASLRNAFGDLFEIAGPASDKLRASIEGLIVTVTDPRFVQALQNIGALLFSIAGVALDVVAGLGLLVGAVGAFFAFETATTRLALASDTANLAIADEIAQINALTVSTGAAIVVSEIAALNKLREAEAHLASADAKLEEARANILNSDSYQGLIERIGLTQDALLSMNAESALGAAAYEETEQSLVAMLARQKELLDLIPETSAEYAAAAASVENLRTRIAEAKDGTVVLGGAVSDAADTTAALARLANGINFSGALQGAMLLANDLDVSIEKAIALNALLNISAGIPSTPSKPKFSFGLGPVDPDASDRASVSFGRMGDSAESAARRVLEINRASAALTKTLSGSGGGGGGGGGVSQAARDAQSEMNKLQSEAEKIILGLMTPMDEYNAAIEQANTLLDAGVLGMSDYTAHVDQLGVELQNQQPFIADFKGSILDAAMGGVDSFDALRDAIIRAGLEYALFGTGQFAPKGGGGGLFGSLIGGLLSFDGGGSTGSGPRSGGMDGRGGFPAILHPNETIIDHTRGGASGNQSVNVTVTMDPSTGALGAFVRDQAGRVVAQATPGIASQAVAQTQAAFRNSKQGFTPS